ncbi:putative dual-specificity RNA methyltransferase RlmN [Planctomycetales bacterium]|nr:putative dual-specificity RNA methyltransferase RlmN [Planctomycetales bacterium]GHS96623.1 putative dual-specificity RNA methyltransferase RlmN [Planctomycetales bacterium]GHT05120.1 putative dual-specificity RNA methyltransferase RlmN [Planctomycetales bacterium]
MKPSLLALTLAELQALLPRQPRFRAAQLWDWLHRSRVDDFAAMKNLPASLRQTLSDGFVVRELREAERLTATDRLTEKWLYFSGDAAIETALIREIRGRRRTLCVSCMCGCPVGCAFCATGQGGFTRPLTVAEIVEQVYRADRHCAETDGAGLSNVVFMGMGEPLLNYAAVVAAAGIVSSPDGLNLGNRQITVSTVGIPAGILRLAQEHPAYRLAFSLHAPTQALREQLIPLARQYPLTAVLPALEIFANATSRRLTIEYCLIAGVNDDLAQARQLNALLRNLPAQINLIPFNPIGGDARHWRPPAAAQVRAFQDALKFPATLRAEKGRDINAACGQLRARTVEKEELKN